MYYRTKMTDPNTGATYYVGHDGQHTVDIADGVTILRHWTDLGEVIPCECDGGAGVEGAPTVPESLGNLGTLPVAHLFQWALDNPCTVR